MSEKRFELAEDSNGLYSIFDNENKEDEPLIYGARFGTEEIVDLLNEQEEEISYWKHRVSSLLFILSQFDNDKVKKLLEELDEL